VGLLTNYFHQVEGAASEYPSFYHGGRPTRKSSQIAFEAKIQEWREEAMNHFLNKGRE
jgi:hypothetical protein